MMEKMMMAVVVTFALWRSGVTSQREVRYPGRLQSSSSTSSHGVILEDTVLQVANKQRQDNMLGHAPDIPALTDVTFPATAYDSHSKLVVVLFYLPFDPVGMVFLKQYQEAGRELTTDKGDHSQSSHPLTRVNCFDWTDVCQRENVTTYPVIHLYQKGKWREQYRDALDKNVLVRTVSLLQCEQPLRLGTEEEVQRFLDGGHLPSLARQLVDNMVILKPSPSLTEVAPFTSVVEQLETQMLFAIVDPEVPTHIGIEVGLLHVRRKDKHEPYVTLTDTHSLTDPDAIRQFLLGSKFHLLPELTFRNFPELHEQQKPLGVLFLSPTDPESPLHARTLVDVIKSKRVHNVTFCYMGVSVDNPMADKLLRTYTDQTALPAFVIVDLAKREVFAFRKWGLRDKKLLVWILGVQGGKITPFKHLTKGQWGPSKRHFDFLRKMDKVKDRKKKNDNGEQRREGLFNQIIRDRERMESMEDENDDEEEGEEEESLMTEDPYDVEVDEEREGTDVTDILLEKEDTANGRRQHHALDVEDQKRRNQHRFQEQRNQHQKQMYQNINNQNWNKQKQNEKKLPERGHQNQKRENPNHHKDSPNRNRNNQNQPKQNQNQNERNGNQHRPNQNRHDQNRNPPFQNRNQNQNQQRQNQNQRQRNRNDHYQPNMKKKIQQKLQKNPNLQRLDPNGQQRGSIRISEQDLRLHSDKEHKKRPPESADKNAESSKTLPKRPEHRASRQRKEIQHNEL